MPIIISNPVTGQKLTKEDVQAYYSNPDVQKELLKSLRGKDLVTIMSRSPEHHILRRRDISNGSSRINSPEDLNKYTERRFSEFHPTIGKRTDEIWVDIDAGKNLSTEELKDTTLKVEDILKRLPQIKQTQLAFSGGDGFYVRGLLNKKQDTNKMRELLKQELKSLLDRKSVV